MENVSWLKLSLFRRWPTVSLWVTIRHLVTCLLLILCQSPNQYSESSFVLRNLYLYKNKDKRKQTNNKIPHHKSLGKCEFDSTFQWKRSLDRTFSLLSMKHVAWEGPGGWNPSKPFSCCCCFSSLSPLFFLLVYMGRFWERIEIRFKRILLVNLKNWYLCFLVVL